MGTSALQQQIANIQAGYIKEPRIGHRYFGNHTLLISHTQKQLLIHKQLHFRSSAEHQQFLQAYEVIDRKPFSIIYPNTLIRGTLEACSTLYEVNLYFDIVGCNLLQIVNKEGPFNESKAWFLLNEVSKAMEVLAECQRPHWAISPETIYQNRHQNYLIYDSLFVLGFDYQSFLMRKLDNKELLTDKAKSLLARGVMISHFEGFQEDCYCLGFVILFSLTGVHPNSLPQLSEERSKVVRTILQEKRATISKEMIEIILELTQRDAMHRMDLYRLRRFLKEKEPEIIHKEEKQYQKSSRTKIETKRERLKTPQARLSHQCHNKLIPFSPPHHRLINPTQFPMIQNPSSSRLTPHPQTSMIIGSQRSNVSLTRINSHDRLQDRK